ncbi:MAG: hypothetical protein WCL08_06055 [Verrucomicrobiota bacterium]
MMTFLGWTFALVALFIFGLLALDAIADKEIEKEKKPKKPKLP